MTARSVLFAAVGVGFLLAAAPAFAERGFGGPGFRGGFHGGFRGPGFFHGGPGFRGPGFWRRPGWPFWWGPTVYYAPPPYYGYPYPYRYPYPY
jgi:hypothetical protein